MDKLFKSSWFVKIISFLIALMLYTMVVAGGQTSSNPFGFVPSSQPSNSNQPQASAQVKLKAHYNNKKYLVSDLPERVTVLLQGPSGLLTKVRLVHNYEVYVDLTGKGPGTYKVPVEVKDFPDGLTVSTFPEKVPVTISAKKTKTFPVHIALINSQKVADGYEVGKPVSSPLKVKVTATQDVMQNIAFVEGMVNVAGADDTVDTTVPIHVFDKEGNELNVSVSPSDVNVEVPISENSKVVPVQPVTKGHLPAGLSVQSITFKTDQVTLFGPKNVLEDIPNLKVPVELKGIDGDTTENLNVQVPDGVSKVTPEQVSAIINVTKQSTKTLDSVPITVKGKSDGENISFQNPQDQQVQLTLTGKKQVLQAIGSSDVQAAIDISDLPPGEHTVPIEITGPDQVKIDSNVEEAVIDITASQG